MNVIDFIRQMAEAHGVQGLPADDRDLIAVIVIYALVAIGLVHRWRTRHRPGRRAQLERGLAVMDGVAGVLRVVLFLTVGVLIALARASFGPHYRDW